jgi:cellulose synthase/poly-beta-1,6-N-acetylglucosamine synthase-like glycosyltransferase
MKMHNYQDQGESRQPQPHGDNPQSLRWELALTLAAIAVTLSAGTLATGDSLMVLADHVKTGHPAESLAQLLFLTIVSFLIYGACVYEFSRWGHLRRLLKHRPVPENQLARVWEEPSPPRLAILVPSYKESVRVVRKTLLSAALQEYPNRRVVLLIDDPPHPVDLEDSRALITARELPREVCSLLEEMRKRCESALQHFRERSANGPLDLRAETARLVQLYRKAAAWFEGQANRYEILDHADRLFVDLTFLEPARQYHRQASEWEDGTGCSLRCQDGRGLLLAYERLLTRFQTELTSFERKQYVNLSHEPNKAMNLNSYIGLMGKRFREVPSPQGLLLESSGDRHADMRAPDADFVLMVDADSVLSPEYALRLIHLMRQSGNERVAVVQTPYSAFPGAPGVLERIAGATTDIQYCIHQGFTHYGATFWVGANAVVRKAALEEIAEHDHERGYPITRFVQDRTVIEDTESSIDLVDRDWSLFNYPERLAFSATPPDFGCLLIQRRRWANGGLIILQKLLRHVLRHATRRRIVGESLMRCHYLTSIAAVNLGLLLTLGFSFEHSMRSSWLPLTAVPYYGLYLRDLQRTGYRASDLLRVYALNLVLIPVNVGGVLRSLSQMWTGRKAAFGRTPKITGRTVAPPLYIVAEYVILGQWLLGAALDAVHGRGVHGVFAVANAGFLAYGVSRFIGLRESWDDLRLAWRRRSVLRLATPTHGGPSPQRVHYAARPRYHQTLRISVLALGVWSVLTSTPVAARTELAVSVDDLPTHGVLPRGTSRLEIAQVMLRALQTHQVPGACGFVNGKQVHANPEHLMK